MRREIMDLHEMIVNQVMSNGMNEMISGSRRDGFRFRGSDVDTMFWFNDHRVIWNLKQTNMYKFGQRSLLLADPSNSPPGFTLLQLLTPPKYREINSACIRINDIFYVSSSMCRRVTYINNCPNTTEHGPCSRKHTHTNTDFDYAYCFACDFWPPSATSWINRCHSWPQRHVVHDVIRNGCHFVAIGHKLGNYRDTEWRISFSLAEKKLVCAMNHCQFLTYGLLKLFLQEAINSDCNENDKLLCSYHMKTAIFWLIQQNTMPFWRPNNLLDCFWVCFKLILKWTYEGVCPNFFIPQNNMFLGRINGGDQTSLFIKLYGLYEKGLESLLQIPSIKSTNIISLCNPTLSARMNEQIGTYEFDVELFHEVYCNGSNLCLFNAHHCIRYLDTLERLLHTPLTQFQVVMLQRHAAVIFQHAAFILHKNKNMNKLMYLTDKLSCRLLRLAAKFGCISDMLFIAMYYYKTLRYDKALAVIEMTKDKLAKPYVMYISEVDPERYSAAVEGLSWSKIMREVVAWDVTFYSSILWMNELKPEQQCSLMNKYPACNIPPFILLHMIEFLCLRYTDSVKSQTIVNNLQSNLFGTPVLVKSVKGAAIVEKFSIIANQTKERSNLLLCLTSWCFWIALNFLLIGLLEQQSVLRSGYSDIGIPLYVPLQTCRPTESTTISSLNDFQDLVHHNKRKQIHIHKRAMSSQILGICQQMTGNHQAALKSHQ
ncbi:uncharacterized protein LOC134240990 [Saccostrea cucullata]|uniref:uncharacterized protein LOC134240990 n=1 Tax=Saccostrea cuccullata TaxID=36930 RepID=UPI002ED133BB